MSQSFREPDLCECIYGMIEYKYMSSKNPTPKS